ncbi:hypothetical protein Y032_0050g1922 [Ancylostoma ceylanicum]|uniref:Uncharacterized protein n=1 Tax=Ancylostoma ceylanicum TaxID=53326 RepID=A0A016U960_9BILA|nr:hypothetical protein Y032_0050g1922 [Ancylostoma ceylanicum]
MTRSFLGRKKEENTKSALATPKRKSPGTPNETSSTQVIQENVASERLLRTQESVDLAQTPPSMQSLKLSNQICDWLELSKTQRSIVRNLYKMRHKNCFEIINQ